MISRHKHHILLFRSTPLRQAWIPIHCQQNFQYQIHRVVCRAQYVTGNYNTSGISFVTWKFIVERGRLSVKYVIWLSERKLTSNVIIWCIIPKLLSSVRYVDMVFVRSGTSRNTTSESIGFVKCEFENTRLVTSLSDLR